MDSRGGSVYRNALYGLRAILLDAGHSHWADYISEDIYAWDNSQSTSHHRRAYGGMGSLNDIVFVTSALTDVWKNHVFESMRAVAFSFSHHATVDLDSMFANPFGFKLLGSICCTCKHSEVSALDVEEIVSLHTIGAIISQNLTEETVLRLQNIESLRESLPASEVRKKIVDAIIKAGISFEPERRNRMKPCPVCSSDDTMVYRWDVNLRGAADITAAKDNLPLT